MKKKPMLIALILMLTFSVMIITGCDNGKEAKFPSKPITQIINFSAGSGTDLSARTIATAMEKQLGQPINPVNKTGGGGTIGVGEVAKAPKDGYTFGMVTFMAAAMSPHTMNVPYTIDDFEFLGTYGKYKYAIAVKSDSPYKSIKDLVAAAKTQNISYAATGFPNVIPFIELGNAEGVKFTFVPHNSGPECATSLLGGHVNAMLQNVNDTLPFVKNGEMRVLAVADAERWEELPDIPTLKELGYDTAIESWIAFAVPKGTPPENKQVLQEAFNKSLEDPGFKDIMQKVGLKPMHITGEEFRKICDEATPKLIEQHKALGLSK
ncbi:MAG: tripartite tricarboxylate transporter substrate binding protein [Syntrophomonas sp.]|nr:tripartite tricarboxylate transporter substrate binding protein [Syntrophomonas sp.]